MQPHQWCSHHDIAEKLLSWGLTTMTQINAEPNSVAVKTS